MWFAHLPDIKLDIKCSIDRPEMLTVMAHGAAVSRPCAVAVERRPGLRAAAAVLTEIWQASGKKNKKSPENHNTSDKQASK